MIPGTTTADKAKWARDHGADGLELGVWGEFVVVHGVVGVCNENAVVVVVVVVVVGLVGVGGGLWFVPAFGE